MSLRAFGPGGGQIWRVVHISARASFGVLGGNRCLAYAKSFEGVCWQSGDSKPQHLSATTHLHDKHMYGVVNTGAFIKYYIGAFNIQLTEYNHNL